MTAPQELQTPRLLLRSFEREDIPAIVRLAGAREISATTTSIPHPYTIDNAWSFYEHMVDEHGAGRSVTFAITILSENSGRLQVKPGLGGELCGAVGLTIAHIHRRAELGYWVGVTFWGKGYATEAANAVVAFGFETLCLHRIHASHFPGNIASQRVLEKVGMRHEGQSRQHVKKGDGFMDLENYGILAAEFRSGK